MGLFDIFNKSESKKQNEEKKHDNLIVSDFVELESQETSEEIFENKEKNSSEPQTDDETLTSYHDSLETQKPGKKQKKHATRESYKDQNIWRDVKSIEEKVDNLHVDRAVKKRTDLDKKVDGILKRKK